MEQRAQNKSTVHMVNLCKGDKNIQWRKDSILNKWLLEKLEKHVERLKLNYFF